VAATPASRAITRRRALTWLGGSAALGAAAALDREAAALVLFGQRAPQAAGPMFARGAVIRTLLKDLPPDALAGGPVLFHEHLSMHYPPQAKAHFTDDVALMVDEARAARTDGIACIVDGGHPDMSRSLDALKRIATESGMPIVASGGYYMQRTYPPDIATRSVDQIADELAREAADQHLGAFGEIGQQGGVLTDDEKKVFQAVAKAHVRTGLPVFTHNAYTGTRPVQNPVPHDAALRQLDALEGAGARPAHLAIGHVCCLDDPKAEVAQQLAKRGAFVGFDRVTIPIVPDAERVTMIMAMVEAGYADQVLISSDFAVAGSLKKNGGAGLAQASTVFGPMLLEAGMTPAMLHHILVDNPRRFLAFVPAKT
jgi:phosphotriesterase-related protein